MSDLRKNFFNLMADAAKKDKKFHLLVGDLGYSFYEEYAERFPDQFTNAGIAEQSMIGIAAGMAREGMKPVVYSSAIFLVMRALEQIRDDICYPNLNVKLIGTGAAEFLGFTHVQNPKNECKLILENFPNIDIWDKEYLNMSTLTEIGPRFIQL